MSASEPEVLADQIDRELATLRQREGLTAARLGELGPGICSLTATADEKTHNRQMTDSLAAYAVLRCAILALRHTHKLIIRRTLNLDDGLAETLEVRRTNLMKELGIRGLNNYLRRETAAYVELRSELLIAETSPCRSPVPPEDRDTITADLVQHLREAHSTIESAIEQLAALLQLLTLEDTPPRQNALIGLLSETRSVFSGVTWSWPENRDHAAALHWVRHVLRDGYGSPPTPDDLNTGELQVFFRNSPSPEVDALAFELWAERLRIELPGRQPPVIPTEFWEAKHRGFLRIAGLLKEAERLFWTNTGSGHAAH